MVDGVKIQTYRDLEVWQVAMEMVNKVFDLTDQFPKDELFSLTKQIRRSAISVPSNIAEGSARLGTKELVHFLHIARGSLAEMETQLLIAKQRKYGDSKSYEEIEIEAVRIGKMIIRLVQPLERQAA